MQRSLHCFVLYSSRQHCYSKRKAHVICRSQKCPTSQIILLPTTGMLSGFLQDQPSICRTIAIAETELQELRLQRTLYPKEKQVL